MAEVRMWLRRANNRTNLLLAVVACIAFQPIFSMAVFAQEGTAGNLTGVSTDIAAPTIPTSGEPHSQTKTTKNFLFSWQAAVDTESQVNYIFRISRSSANLGIEETSGAWYSSLLSAPTIAATAIPHLTDGTWYWQVQAEDATGNKSAWSELWSVTLNTQGPVISIAQPLTDEMIGRRTVSLEATISESKATSFGVELDGIDITANVHAVSNSNSVALATDWLAGSFSDGMHSLKIWAADEVGHVSQTIRSFSIDTTAPELSTPLINAQRLQGVVSLELSAVDTHLEMSSIEIVADNGEVVVQRGADLEASSSDKITRIWNTLDSKNGTYRVIFTGRDTVGNETVIQRTVTVMNIFAGVESATKDLLLEELSASLNQPFITPQLASSSNSHLPIGALPDISDIEAHPYDTLLENIPHFTAGAATENGWRLFGVLWYWWLLGGALLGMGGMYSLRLVKRSWNQQLPDSV